LFDFNTSKQGKIIHHQKLPLKKNLTFFFPFWGGPLQGLEQNFYNMQLRNMLYQE